MDLEKIKSDDMTVEEQESLQGYVKNGLPGIQKLKESDIFQWFELYMSGKTYNEIANITKSKKDLILYISKKSKWHEKRIQHYSEIADTLMDKITMVKAEGANTVATMLSALNKFYGNKFNKFLSTNNEEVIEELDTKMLSQYYKSLDMIDKLLESGVRKPPEKSPTVNVNVGTGAEIKQNEDGSVEITDNAASELLGILANLQKDKKKD